MSATQDGFAPGDNWRADHSVVPEMPTVNGGTRRGESPSKQVAAVAERGPGQRLRLQLFHIAETPTLHCGLHKFPPAQIVSTRLMLARFANCHLRDGLDYPIKVHLTNRSDFGVGR